MTHIIYTIAYSYHIASIKRDSKSKLLPLYSGLNFSQNHMLKSLLHQCLDHIQSVDLESFGVTLTR